VVTNSDSQNNLPLKDSEYLNNMITLHASTCDTKNDASNEIISSGNLVIIFKFNIFKLVYN
jgi:hypothetical protein